MSDITVVGGGLVGASLALALRSAGLDCALVEARGDEPGEPGHYDARSTAVSASSVRVLHALGVWAEVSPHAAPIRRIHVSERGQFGFCRLDAAEFGVEALGHVIENTALNRALWRALRSSGVELLAPAALTGVERGEDALELTLQLGTARRTRAARLLIAADGARSSVRELLGLPSRGWSYETSAVVANVTPERPCAGLAFERFTPSGPLAMLPLYDGRYALVWTLPGAEASRVAALPEAAFRSALQQAFGFRLGRISKAGRREVFPLALTLGAQPTEARAVLIGNAAHGLHPVAGQGFNLGLRDAAALAEILAGQRAQRPADFDPGDDAALALYHRWRRGDQQRAVMFTDGLVRLFSNPLRSVALARNSGMLLLDLLPPLKSAFAEHGMGMGAQLPRLARGAPLPRVPLSPR